MKNIKLILIFILIGISYSIGYGQNVGIGQTTPTNTLHVTPQNAGDDPVRIDGLNYFTPSDTSIVVIDNNTGLVRYIDPSDLKSILGVDFETGPGVTISGDTIFLDIVSGPGISIMGNTISNTAPDVPVAITGTGGSAVTGTYPNFNVNSTDYTAGTGITVSPTGVITNTAPDVPVSITGTGINTVTGTHPNFTVDGTLVAGSGISVTGNTITNTSPDVPVSITGTGINTVTGTHPNFTVDGTLIAGSGISVSGNTITNSSPDVPVAILGTGGSTVSGTYPNYTVNSTNYSAGTGITVSPTGVITNTSLNTPVSITGTGINTVTGTHPNFTVDGTLVAGPGISVSGNTITNSSPDVPVAITGTGGSSVSGTYPNYTVNSTNYTAGSGISVSPTGVITNTAQSQSITLTGTGATTVSGTHPNFTINSTDNVNDADSVIGNEYNTNATLTGTNLNIIDGGGTQTVSLASIAGDVTGVNAGAGLTGGGTSGTPTITAAANNGLNVDAVADRIQLGGGLIENTTLTYGTNSLFHDLTSTGDFIISDAGIIRMMVEGSNGRVSVGSNATAGNFNVTGTSFYSNDLYLRDGSVTGANLVRLFDSQDDGVIDVYRAGLVTTRIHGNGNTFFNSGNVGIGITNPLQKLHVVGTGRFSTLAGSGNRMVIANANGDLLTQTIPTGDVTGVTAGAGLTGGGTTGTPTITAAANNGLVVDAAADRIQLGGPLVETTVINHGAYTMIHDLNSTGDFLVREGGLDRLAVFDNGRVTVGSPVNAGQFNVTGNSFFSDDLWLRDGSVTGGNLARIYDSSDDGIFDLYRAGVVVNRFHGNGSSFINAGNFGLGTNVPVQKLHVIGTGRFSNLAGSGNRMVIASANGDLLTQAIPTGDVTGVTAGLGLSGGGTTGTPTINASANNGINVDAAADRIQLGGLLTETTTITNGIYSMIYNLNSTGDFLIRDNGSNRFAVLDNGRTTIGGTGSAGQFNVTGNSFYSDDIWLRDGAVNTGDNLIRLYDSSDDGIIDVYRNNAVTARISGNGNSFINGGFLGIGTTNPADPLYVEAVNHTGAASINLTANTANVFTACLESRGVYANGTTGVGTWSVATSFATNNGPQYLRGTVTEAFGSASGKVGLWSNADAGGSPAYSYGLYSSYTNYGGGAAWAGFFSGSVFTTGSFTPSFSGLKRNIRSSNSSIAKLMDLDVKEYEFRTEEYQHMNLPGGNHTGIMADQMKQLYPELVKTAVQPATDPEKAAEEEITFDAVNYTGLVPHLVKGTQEQQTEIEALKTKNNALQNEVDILKSELLKIKAALGIDVEEASTPVKSIGTDK